MIVCELLPITSADLTTNLATTDNTVWVPGTSATAGEFYTYNEHNLECLASTTIAPSDASADWFDWGAVNYLKPFDDKNSTQAESATAIVYEFTMNAARPINAISIQNVQAATVRIEVTDADEGLVYDNTYDLLDWIVTDFSDFFFKPVGYIDRFTDLDLPQYLNTTIKVTINPVNGAAKVGRIALSSQDAMGALQWGYGFGFDDYSEITRNKWGDTTFVEGDYSDGGDFPVKIKTSVAYSVKQKMTELRAKKVLFIGDPARLETHIIGYYLGLNFIAENKRYSFYNLTIEGTN